MFPVVIGVPAGEDCERFITFEFKSNIKAFNYINLHNFFIIWIEPSFYNSSLPKERSNKVKYLSIFKISKIL